MWGDAFYVEDSRIVCFISSDGGGVVLSAQPNLSLSERVGAYMQVLRQKVTAVPAVLSLMGGDPRTTRSGPLTLPSTSALGAIPSHKVQITEHFGSPSGRVATQLDIDRLIEITMLATPFAKDVYPPTPPSGVYTGGVGVELAASESPMGASRATTAPVPAGTLGVGLVSGEHSSHAAGSVAGRVPPGVFHGFIPAEPTVLAASLLASDEICLQLYGGVNSAGQIVNHRLRYLRTTKVGDTVTDVILAPAQRKAT
jgi:hypothetical protein